MDMELIHIRGLPSLEEDRDSTTRSLPFTQFDSFFVRNGVYFAAGTSAQLGNTLFSSSLDTASAMKSGKFVEMCNVTTAVERVWDIKEVETSNIPSSCNFLLDQVIRPPRKFVMLTNQGKIITKIPRMF